MNPGEGRAPDPMPAATPPSGRRALSRILWVLFALVLALTLAAEALVRLHPRYRLESWFGFNAAYGFLGCIAMVLIAKALGAVLQRPESYYEPSGASPAAQERAGD